MEGQRCHVCRFIFYQNNPDDCKVRVQTEPGICRRYPPSPSVIPVALNKGIVHAQGQQNIAMAIQTAWPAVNSDDWCGEFERPFGE